MDKQGILQNNKTETHPAHNAVPAGTKHTKTPYKKPSNKLQFKKHTLHIQGFP